jgi:tetratricopeptide (TPR) repeat protein
MIADILQARGQVDDALRIYREEQLPAYERLGDVRAKAVTMGQIADIVQARGQLDEALRIRQEEQLPVYERLGDVRAKAVTMGKIADILKARGQFDEALRIFQEKLLPVFEHLGHERSKVVTMGRIADILQDRGQLDEALRLHEDRALIYKSLGDSSGLAHVQFSVARLMLERGDHEGGDIQAIYENLAAAFEINLKSGRADAIAAIGSLLAQIMARGGLIEEALVVLTHAESANATLGSEIGLNQVARLREAIETRRPGA